MDGWRSKEEALEVIADGLRLHAEHEAAGGAGEA